MSGDYLETVAAPLRGPRRLRDDMLAELGDGFEEAVADGVEHGLSRDEAVRRASADFGSPGVVAAAMQRELEAAQARRTAWTLVIALPAMTVLWDLLGGRGDPGLAVTVLARLTDAASAAAFTAAALVLTGRLDRRAASACGALGVVSMGVALGCSTVIALIAEPSDTPPTLPFLMLASAVGTVWVSASALRALRVGAARARVG
ncbi:permease prefix domain 1-containing protein [Glycomyces tenuis]|uniref:permease prefix domain 1-containing protein n=1 Tax=Glycomyces tenuis TaxID=58116 RepID=UPI000414A147|nr:permease prefix domain 1-containing protein [Glycomyces tenuis]